MRRALALVGRLCERIARRFDASDRLDFTLWAAEMDATTDHTDHTPTEGS